MDGLTQTKQLLNLLCIVFKDDNIKLHMKSFSVALVSNRTARFSHVIVHGSQIYTLFTQTQLQRVSRCAVP